MKYALAVSILITSSVSALSAQTPARVTIGGTLTAVDVPGNQVTVKSDKGDTVTLSVTPRSNILRLPA